MRRAGSWLAGCAAGCVALAFASGAAAQTFGYNDRRHNESRQDWAFEIYGGAWVPAIDNEFNGGASPYHDIFGNGLQPTFGLELEWEAVRLGPVGSLGVGLGVGYSTMGADAPFTADTSATSDPAGWHTRSSERTGLNVYPFKLELVLRLDGLVRRAPFTLLVPYAKLGLAYSIWWVTIGSGTAHDTSVDTSGNVQSSDAIGGSLGWTAAVGVMLLLDPFEARLAREFDSTDGVNHTYLFVEAYYSDLRGFTGRRQLDVGTAWDLSKTALAFNIGLTFEF